MQIDNLYLLPSLSWILILSKTVRRWREFRGGLLTGSQISMIIQQVLLLCYSNIISNPLKNEGGSVD